MYQKLSKSRIGTFARLGRRRFREETGLFMAEGHKCVSDTIGSFSLEALVATEQWLAAHADSLSAVAQDCVWSAAPRDMERISQLATAPDVIAVYRLPDWSRGEVPTPQEGELCIALDDVQDPGNLGTIVRAADWFGVRRIYASSGTADVFGSKAVQATMGAISRVRVYYCDLPELLSGSSLPRFGTLLDGDNLYEATFSGREGILVFGNEGKGLSTEVRQLVTDRLLIPPYPAVGEHPESLNVGVAAAVTLAEFRRRAAQKI